MIIFCLWNKTFHFVKYIVNCVCKYFLNGEVRKLVAFPKNLSKLWYQQVPHCAIFTWKESLEG